MEEVFKRIKNIYIVDKELKGVLPVYSKETNMMEKASFLNEQGEVR